MTDENITDDSKVSEQSEEQPAETPEVSEQPAEEEHALKESLREGAAKAFGLAVEVGSLLSGQSGELVDAERELSEHEAEEFIDRIDGEG